MAGSCCAGRADGKSSVLAADIFTRPFALSPQRALGALRVGENGPAVGYEN